MYSKGDVKAVRKANNMTQTQFAEAMGVCRRSVVRWERSGVHWKNHRFEQHRFELLQQPELPLQRGP